MQYFAHGREIVAYMPPKLNRMQCFRSLPIDLCSIAGIKYWNNTNAVTYIRLWPSKMTFCFAWKKCRQRRKENEFMFEMDGCRTSTYPHNVYEWTEIIVLSHTINSMYRGLNSMQSFIYYFPPTHSEYSTVSLWFLCMGNTVGVNQSQLMQKNALVDFFSNFIWIYI